MAGSAVGLRNSLFKYGKFNYKIGKLTIIIFKNAYKSPFASLIFFFSRFILDTLVTIKEPLKFIESYKIINVFEPF